MTKKYFKGGCKIIRFVTLDALILEEKGRKGMVLLRFQIDKGYNVIKINSYVQIHGDTYHLHYMQMPCIICNELRKAICVHSQDMHVSLLS